MANANDERDMYSSGESEPSEADSDPDDRIDCDDLDDDLHYIPGQVNYDKNFFPSIKNFTSRSGIRDDIQLDGNDPIHYFKYFFDDYLLTLICTETIRYQEQNPLGERSKMANWSEITPDELLRFFALTILMGHIRKGCLEDYWSTNPMIATPIFHQTMTRNRYLQILRFLHFEDNNNPSTHPLRKLKAVIDYLKMKFSSVLHPGQKLCIDESLMLWKGRLSFKQYLPLKRHRFGIKIFELVDCETGFILDFIIYTGQNTEYERFNLGITGDIVAHFLKPYFHKGHIVYTDNWYTSPILAEFLHEKDTGICGTVKKIEKDFQN